jgi:transcriptional regulator with XRE-family HTH domain
MVRNLKNERTVTLFGLRLQAIRRAADLSQAQVYEATGISQSQIARTELGQLNTGISHVGIYAELFGLDDHEMFHYDAPVPEAALLKKNVSKFLKLHGFDPAIFLKQSQGPTYVIGDKLMGTKFLSTPKLASEIVAYCKEKFDAEFTTTQASKVLNGLYKAGLLEKISTEAKTKFKYRKA